MLYLGVDAGGTKCRARLVDQRGETRGEGSAGPANIRLGVSTASAAINKAFRKAAEQGSLEDIPLSDISAVIGIAGNAMTDMIDTLRAQPFFSALGKVTFVSDAEIANLGAHAGQDGGTVIVGTGSIAIAKRGEKIFKIGGYGFPISDLGSGADIGLSAVREMLQAIDGLISSSGMTNEIFKIFDDDPLNAIAAQDCMSASDYAKFAPVVVSHAQKNDPVAAQIMKKSAQHIEKMICALDNLNLPRLSITGGLGPIITQWLDPSVKALLSHPLGDPLHGAIELAKSRQ